jgi:hypothetical protein
VRRIPNERSSCSSTTSGERGSQKQGQVPQAGEQRGKAGNAKVVRRERLPEAGPSRARVELGLGAEEVQAAGVAHIRAFSPVIVVLIGEGRFGAVLEEHVVVVARQQSPPPLLGAVQLLDHVSLRSKGVHPTLVTGYSLPGLPKEIP